MLAATAHTTRVGSMLLRVAAALFERDRSRLEAFYQGKPWDGVVALPVDRQGAVHVNLVLSNICCWEPFVGRTAENARHLAACAGEGFQASATRAMCWYVYKAKDAATEEPPLATAPAPDDLHKKLLQTDPSGRSSFFVPFIDVFLLAFDGSELLHDRIIEHLRAVASHELASKVSKLVPKEA